MSRTEGSIGRTAAWPIALGPFGVRLHVQAAPALLLSLSQRLPPVLSDAQDQVEVVLSARDRAFYRADDRLVSAPSGTFAERHDFRIRRTGGRWIASTLARADSAEMALRWIAGRELLERGGLALHGAAAVWRGQAHLFLGASGAGKSTLAAECDADALLAVELSLVAFLDGRFWVYPSPFWDQTAVARRATAPAPLAAIWLLEGWGPTSLPRLDPPDALLGLLARIPGLGEHSAAHQLALDAAAALVAAVPVGRLSWRRGDSLAPLLAHRSPDGAAPPSPGAYP